MHPPVTNEFQIPRPPIGGKVFTPLDPLPGVPNFLHIKSLVVVGVLPVIDVGIGRNQNPSLVQIIHQTLLVHNTQRIVNGLRRRAVQAKHLDVDALPFQLQHRACGGDRRVGTRQAGDRVSEGTLEADDDGQPEVSDASNGLGGFLPRIHGLEVNSVHLALHQCFTHGAKILHHALRPDTLPHLRVQIRPVALRKRGQAAQDPHFLAGLLHRAPCQLRSNQAILR
mmetsp:Transcript_9387/g.20549  ORF Transcript_9387/g.20549 Transcript_9387/m.20549 type:complete len:225 (-) Transcript_9387:1543-2217(-)